MKTCCHCGPFFGEVPPLESREVRNQKSGIIFSMSEKARPLRSRSLYRLRRYILAMTLLFCSAVGVGCGSSLDIPSVEESEKKIAGIAPLLDSIDLEITSRTQFLPKGFDIVTHTRMSAINTLLNGVMNAGKNDIRFDFLQTRPLWSEQKSIFGIAYMNVVDVDTGRLDVDLKHFQFTGLSDNIVNAEVEIEGTGSIKVSGTYAGLRASAAPQVHLYLNERLQFSISTADSDYIRLTPLPKIVLLKAKVTIHLLGWDIPYYREIPLQAAQLMKPVLIPSAMRSEIVFPLPAAQYGGEKVEFVKRSLVFTRSSVGADNGILEYKSDISFIKPLD